MKLKITKLKTVCLALMLAGNLAWVSTAAADSLLPSGGDILRTQGYDLPEPFGIGVNYSNVRQNVQVNSINLHNLSLPFSELGITVPSNPAIPLPDDLFSIAAGKTRMRSFTTAARADAWILPFMNVYVIAGKTRGSSVSQINAIPNPVIAGQFTISLAPTINNMLASLSPEHIATLAANPAFVDLVEHPESTLAGLQPVLTSLKEFRLNFKGTTYGTGLTFVGGYQNFFASLDGNFTQTNFDVLDGHINAVTITPRAGYRFKVPGPDSLLSVWIGSMYQYTQQTYRGKASQPGLPPTLAPLTNGGSFEVRQNLSSPWNILTGAQYSITRNFNISAEVGFAQRNSLLVSGEFRF